MDFSVGLISRMKAILGGGGHLALDLVEDGEKSTSFVDFQKDIFSVPFSQ